MRHGHFPSSLTIFPSWPSLPGGPRRPLSPLKPGMPGSPGGPGGHSVHTSYKQRDKLAIDWRHSADPAITRDEHHSVVLGWYRSLWSLTTLGRILVTLLYRTELRTLWSRARISSWAHTCSHGSFLSGKLSDPSWSSRVKKPRKSSS